MWPAWTARGASQSSFISNDRRGGHGMLRGTEGIAPVQMTAAYTDAAPRTVTGSRARRTADGKK